MENSKRTPVWLIVVIVILAIGVIGSLVNGGKSENNKDQGETKYTFNGSDNNAPTSDDSSTDKKEYGFNDTFKFDDLEITVGDKYSFDKVKNNFSEYNGKTVIKLPVTVKNPTSETKGLNMFYYKVYGSQGTEVKTLDSYFDDTLTYAGDLRSGAGQTKYLHILYDGDGLYAIEFDNYSEKITVEFNITK